MTNQQSWDPDPKNIIPEDQKWNWNSTNCTRVLTLILKLLKLQQNPAKIKVSVEFKDSA